MARHTWGILLLLAACASHTPVPAPRWVATWTAPQQDYNESLQSPDVTVPPPAPLYVQDQTVRQIVHTSLGGSALRVKLSNLFGTAPVTFAAVHVARSAGGAVIDATTDQPLTFAGQPTLTLAPGAEAWSDSLAQAVATGSDLAVSVYVPAQTQVASVHVAALQTNYLAAGDVTAAATLASPQTIVADYWLAGVDVATDAQAHVLVTFGDSLTDGAQSTVSANHRWPNALDARLQARPELGAVSVVNAGISGNRWLHDAIGPQGAGRFSRDVLHVSGVTDVVIFLGINDIGAALLVPSQEVSAPQITAAIAAAVQAAQAQGLRVAVATLLPFSGAFYYTADGDTKRQAVNAWIRARTDVKVLDFEAVVRDPNNPLALLPAFDGGDHLHLNDAGYAQLAAAVTPTF